MSVTVELRDQISIVLKGEGVDGVSFTFDHKQLDEETGQLPPAVIDKMLLSVFPDKPMTDDEPAVRNAPLRAKIKAALIATLAQWWKEPW